MKAKITNGINSKLAFSLIEISVVILVIGILIAGISKGMDLYQDFKLATARSLTTNSRVGRIPDLTLWFEATSEKSFEKANPSDGEKIATWKNLNLQIFDKINLSQATQATKPTYVKNAVNNLPALRFDNAQNLDANIKIGDIVSLDQATIFIVQNNFSGDIWTSTFGWASGNTRFLVSAQENNKVLLDFGDISGNFRTTTGTLTNFLNQNKVLTFVKNGANTKVKINSNETIATSSVASATINPSLSGVFSVGRYPPRLDDYWFVGYIGEVIIFKRGLSDSEVKVVEEYLSQKWGIKLQ